MGQLFECLILVVCGVFVLIACGLNWDFFFNNRKAKPIIKLFGRNGARIFYGIIGLFVIFCGIMVMVTG